MIIQQPWWFYKVLLEIADPVIVNEFEASTEMILTVLQKIINLNFRYIYYIHTCLYSGYVNIDNYDII